MQMRLERVFFFLSAEPGGGGGEGGGGEGKSTGDATARPESGPQPRPALPPPRGLAAASGVARSPPGREGGEVRGWRDGRGRGPSPPRRLFVARGTRVSPRAGTRASYSPSRKSSAAAGSSWVFYGHMRCSLSSAPLEFTSCL